MFTFKDMYKYLVSEVSQNRTLKNWIPLTINKPKPIGQLSPNDTGTVNVYRKGEKDPQQEDILCKFAAASSTSLLEIFMISSKNKDDVNIIFDRERNVFAVNATVNDLGVIYSMNTRLDDFPRFGNVSLSQLQLLRATVDALILKSDNNTNLSERMTVIKPEDHHKSPLKQCCVCFGNSDGLDCGVITIQSEKFETENEFSICISCLRKICGNPEVSLLIDKDTMIKW